jgi:hypothetical protein
LAGQRTPVALHILLFVQCITAFTVSRLDSISCVFTYVTCFEYAKILEPAAWFSEDDYKPLRRHQLRPCSQTYYSLSNREDVERSELLMLDFETSLVLIHDMFKLLASRISRKVRR